MYELLILASITLACMSLYSVALCVIGIKRAVARYVTRETSDEVEYAALGTLQVVFHACALQWTMIVTDPFEGLLFVPFSCVVHPQMMIEVFTSSITQLIEEGLVKIDVEEQG
jgi:hypothetical protein